MSVSVYLTNKEIYAAIGKADRKKARLTDFYSGEIPPGCMINGLVTNEAELEETLRIFWTKHQLPTKNVRLVILSTHFSLKWMKIPNLNRKKTRAYAANGFQAHENETEQLYDAEVMGRDKSSKLNDALAVMAEREMIENFEELFKRVGVTLASIQPMRSALIGMLSGSGILGKKTCILQIMEGSELHSLL